MISDTGEYSRSGSFLTRKTKCSLFWKPAWIAINFVARAKHSVDFFRESVHQLALGEPLLQHLSIPKRHCIGVQFNDPEGWGFSTGNVTWIWGRGRMASMKAVTLNIHGTLEKNSKSPEDSDHAEHCSFHLKNTS
ncbi:hypothetical protein ACE6H2_021719 [Prunus campanulata]